MRKYFLKFLSNARLCFSQSRFVPSEKVAGVGVAFGESYFLRKVPQLVHVIRFTEIIVTFFSSLHLSGNINDRIGVFSKAEQQKG